MTLLADSQPHSETSSVCSLIPLSINELTQVRGIGSVRKRWLNAIAIHSIEQLANCSAIELEARLKAIGHPVSLGEIESWIMQAQDLLRNNGKADSLSEDSWQPIAALQIELQQRFVQGQWEWRSIVHRGGTQMDAVWTGTSLDQCQQWMQQEVLCAAADSVPEDLSPEDLSSAASLAAEIPAVDRQEKPIEVRVTQVRFWENPHRSIAIDSQRRLTGAIAANVPFNLEVNLAVNLEVNFDAAQQRERVDSGSQAHPVAVAPAPAQWVYRLQCRAKHLGTGQTFCLGDLQANVPLCRNALYSALLDDLSFPLPGVYRMQICLTSETLPALPAVFKLPFVQVDAA